MQIFDESFFNKELATIIPQHGYPKTITEGEKMFDSPNLTFQSKISKVPSFLENKSFVYTNCFAQTTLTVTKNGVIFFLTEKEPPLEECGFDQVRFFLEKQFNTTLVAEFNGELLPGYNTDLYLWAGYYTTDIEFKNAFLNNSLKIIIANIDESYTPISAEEKLDELIKLSLTPYMPILGETLKAEYEFYRHENRGYQACPSIVKTNGGNYLYGVMCTPFGKAGGNGENHHCYVAVGRSKDLINFEDIMIIDPDKDGPSRTFEPILWTDNDTGRVYFAYCQAAGKDYGYNGKMGTFLTYTDNPDDELPIWSKPKRIFHGLLDNPPIKASDGNWYMAINFTRHIRKACFKDDPYLNHLGVYVLKSENGVDYNVLCHVSNADSNVSEPSIVEYEKGKILLTERTEKGSFLMRSTLKNLNFWTYPKPITYCENGKMLQNVASRSAAKCFKFGEMLYAFNDTNNNKRENLSIGISYDGGKTFEYKLLLDERVLSSYPQIVDNGNDEYIIIYDQERIRQKLDSGSEILIAKITKQDIIAGKIVTPCSYLKRLVSRYGLAPREDSFMEQINAAKRIIKAKPQFEEEIKKAILKADERSLSSYKNLCFVCDKIANKK